MHALYARVDRSAAAFVQDSAERLGVSNAEFVEALIFHAQETVDAAGVPSWWSKPVPATAGRLDLTG